MNSLDNINEPGLACCKWVRLALWVTGLLAFELTTARCVAQGSWTVHAFSRNDGAAPEARLVLSGTTLFGTASEGGFPNSSSYYGDGAVFRINVDGSGYALLKRFNGAEGRDVRSGVTLSGNTLYGTTANGGSADSGTVFKVSTDGQGFAILRSFSGADGASPMGDLIISGTTIYGTAYSGGESNCGTVFKMNTDGSGFTVLKHFLGSDGKFPCAGLVLSGQTLYGTTLFTTSGSGTIFKIGTDGTGFSVLRILDGLDGRTSYGTLVLANGVLYGTASEGGGNGCGTVFKIGVNGSGFAVLKTFQGYADGGNPYAGLALAGGTLYGTAYNGGTANFGTLFQVNTDGSGFAVLKSFAGGADGALPRAAPLPAPGALYGTASSDSGGCCGGGQVFGFVLPSVGPVIALAPQDQVVEAGSTAIFSVQAGGAGLTYQWYYNGTEALSAATNSTLQLTNAQPSRAGAYYVVMTNASGAVTSAPASLVVVQPGTTPVGSCTDAALRAALHGASHVTFACDGTLALAGPISITNSVILDGGGHQVILSGGQLVALFTVASNVSFTVLNLTLINGFGTNGAAVYNTGGTLNVSNCVFYGHRSYGLSAAVPDSAGGAIYNRGTLNVSRCWFLQNSATGLGGSQGSFGSLNVSPGPGSRGGNALGGAICNWGVIRVEDSLLSDNVVFGGIGGLGGSGYQGSGYPGDQTGGVGGPGGDANGAALFNNGSAALVNCTVAQNAAAGGAGGTGGSGGQGLDHGFPIYFPGGRGGNGGSGLGALCDSSGLMRVTNCTIAANQAIRGYGGGGSGGYGTNGIACGGIKSAGSSLINTIVSANSNGNWSGSLNDLGHNVSSDNTDARFGPLADNGGFTPTMMLLAGSPAIDAGDPAAAPATDQRGVPRPVGPAPDIGAVEYGWPAVLGITNSGPNGCDIAAKGSPGRVCSLLASPDCSDWVPIATNQFGPQGVLLFHTESTSSQRFFRLVLP